MKIKDHSTQQIWERDWLDDAICLGVSMGRLSLFIETDNEFIQFASIEYKAQLNDVLQIEDYESLTDFISNQAYIFDGMQDDGKIFIKDDVDRLLREDVSRYMAELEEVKDNPEMAKEEQKDREQVLIAKIKKAILR